MKGTIELMRFAAAAAVLYLAWWLWWQGPGPDFQKAFSSPSKPEAQARE